MIASIDSHAWPVSSALTLLCMELVHRELCLAQCAQGTGISVGFQRKEVVGSAMHRKSLLPAGPGGQEQC